MCPVPTGGTVEWVNTSADLVVSQLTHHYGKPGKPGSADLPALSDLDLSIPAGESVSIMGPSGSGKTTLLHIMAAVIRPTTGQVWWRGQDLTRWSDRARTRLRRSDFGFVFQSGQLLAELPAVENAALPLILSGVKRAQAIATVSPILDRLGLGSMLHRRPGELSGGQAQRVAIARAVAGSPGIIFADEPTGALDSATGQDVMGQLVTAARAHGASLVVVTHDRQVADCCSRIIALRDGQLAHDTADAAGAR